MPDTPVLDCPRCGAPMNRHAAKMRDPRSEDEVRLADSYFFGVLEEHHACGMCGTMASRLVPFSIPA